MKQNNTTITNETPRIFVEQGWTITDGDNKRRKYEYVMNQSAKRKLILKRVLTLLGFFAALAFFLFIMNMVSGL